MTRRRAFTAGAVAFMIAPLAAEAQPAGRVPHIAFLTTTSPENSPSANAFRGGLRDLGYVEGQNITIEWRWGRGTTERFADYAADVVRRGVEVIVAANAPAGRAAQRATTTIPIIITTMNDPVGDGFVASLARPGSNITGLAVQTPELQGKRLQLLKELVPGGSRIALLVEVGDRNYHPAVREAELAARTLGVLLHPVLHVRGASDLGAAFATIARERVGGIVVVGGTMLFANRVQLVERGLKTSVPIICDQREMVEAGCLMSYWPSIADLFRRTAVLVDRILKGAKPADLPVEQPTKFELVINLKTARALGLTIPPSLLARADEIIE